MVFFIKNNERRTTQRKPKYAVKTQGKWKTKHQALADPAIRAHLAGEYDIATVSPWYPQYAAIDLDDVESMEMLEIIDSIGLNESNSMICQSESKNSYHVYFKPTYKNTPPTVKLLNTCFSEWATSKSVEVYPKSNKCFRLPFSPKDTILTPQGQLNSDLNGKMYWFNKLDEFDLSGFDSKIKQMPQNITPNEDNDITYKRGINFIQAGLHETRSRNQAQFCVLYSFWRRNYTVEDAIDACSKWIESKHNNYSRDIVNFRKVRAEISRQANIMWNKYEYKNLYPDIAHNNSFGYLTKSDLVEIIKVCEGNLPRMKFMGELIRFCNPRQDRNEIKIHSDKLKEWSSKRNYVRFMEELQQKGVINRNRHYKVGSESKAIQLKWDFRSNIEAIKADDRTTDTITSLANSFAPRELQQYLQSVGVKNDAARKQLSVIYVNNEVKGNIIRI